jgi:hypothetical protein
MLYMLKKAYLSTSKSMMNNDITNTKKVIEVQPSPI